MSTIKILRLTNVMSYKYILFSPNLIFIPAEGVLSNTPMNSSDSQPTKLTVFSQWKVRRLNCAFETFNTKMWEVVWTLTTIQLCKWH